MTKALLDQKLQTLIFESSQSKKQPPGGVLKKRCSGNMQ